MEKLPKDSRARPLDNASTVFREKKTNKTHSVSPSFDIENMHKSIFHFKADNIAAKGQTAPSRFFAWKEFTCVYYSPKERGKTTGLRMYAYLRG